MHVLLVGAGNMSVEYIKVLERLNVNFTIVGRSKERATSFESQFGKKVVAGGLENVFDNLPTSPTHAIIATTLESLEENTLFLLEKGVKYILVEKPAAVDVLGMRRISELTDQKKANVYIAYNRRFYSSVMAAEKLIEEDGGLTSFLFEFTEWSHKIKDLKKTNFQLANLFIGNSTHVVDTAFFLGGKPVEMNSLVKSSLDWHPKGSIFVGSGISDKNILFSYHANWQAPGSWKLELLTKRNRYIFRPFEKLHFQQLGSLSISEIEIDDKLDVLYKPGLYEQVNAFLLNSPLAFRLLPISEGLVMMGYYTKMCGVQQ